MRQQADRLELVAERRSTLGRQVRQLRRDGIVPGVLYGHRFDAVPLQFNGRVLKRLLSHVGGSQLISIRVEGNPESEMALLRDVQRDAITKQLLHVDLYRVSMTERLTAEIPLVTVGESPVVDNKEGILLQGITAIEVECLPGDLVDAIEVDLADLTELDQAIFVRDLAIPANIDVLTDPDEVVVRLVRLAEEEAAEEELEGIVGSTDVEVITARELERDED